MLFVIPDTHLGHENIKKYCNRPDNFESLIEKNWNEIIGKDDTVIHLGDIAMKSDIGDNFIKKLGSWNGRKILIRGNHDKNPDEFYMQAGFTIVVTEMSMRFKDIKILFSHRPHLITTLILTFMVISTISPFMMKQDCICRCRLNTWAISRWRLMITLSTD